jgi:hypothetical protein
MGAARYAPGRATTAFTAALCVSAAAPARAQPATPVALDAASDLPTGLCPDGDALRAAVARRLGRAPFEADAARRIDVRWIHARPWRAHRRRGAGVSRGGAAHRDRR